ncbi:MAG: ribonuclease III [Deltaproteobacteria bacterium]
MGRPAAATELEKRIGYRFRNRSLLTEALRHASLSAREDRASSYQRLEYLGDAVLNLCAAELAFAHFSEAGEGELSRVRSAVINNRNLGRVGRAVGIAEAIHTDRSVRETGGGVTPKMVADTVEAIAGAIFLDGGIEEARRFVRVHLWDDAPLERLAERFDAKSDLQERCQREEWPLPRYRLLREEGPPHKKTFTVSVTIGTGNPAVGSGRTKKEAEREAAAALLDRLSREEDP